MPSSKDERFYGQQKPKRVLPDSPVVGKNAGTGRVVRASDVVEGGFVNKGQRRK